MVTIFETLTYQNFLSDLFKEGLVFVSRYLLVVGEVRWSRFLKP
jgi:hypothetical protein